MSGIPGRSPFPSRNRRRLELDESHNSFASTPGSFLLGNSFARSPSAYISPSSRKPRRFFETAPASTSTQNASTQSASTTAIATTTMDLNQIRTLAKHALGTSTTTASPEMAVFYASVLFSKTQTKEDAYFYASTLHRNAEYRRAVRVLEEYLEQNLEAVLLASQCLAELGEWQEASQLLQEASRLPNATNMLTDDDEAGWEVLRQASSADAGEIHPVSRLCLWRAKCYDATSHPPRAKLFWKRALQLDYQCVAALDSLLDRNLVMPEESLSLIDSLQIPSSMDWLKQVYYARLPVIVAPSTSSQEVDNENRPPPSFMNGHDASSIQMSPSTTFGDQEDSKLPATTSNRVDDALHQLCNVHQLDQSPEVLALAAIRAYRRYDLQAAYNYCQDLIRVDPLTPKAAFVHAATLLALNYKRLLFVLAHEWVKASPQSAKSWFAVGCYYYCCKRYHVAQQHFLRATRLDPLCTDAWIAFGCSFAACDESDQALASFRAAQRLAPAESSALLYMGMEYVRTNHLVLAQHALHAALPGGDPLCWHELGVVHFAKREYETAISWFGKALIAIVKLEKSGGGDNPIELIQNVYWEPTLFNMGHCYRKTLQFEQALQCYEQCLVLVPDNSSALAALGFTKHLQCDLDGAIESYHQALAIKAEDPFCAEMLSRALEESLSVNLVLTEEPSTPSNNRRRRSSDPYSLGSDDDAADMSLG